MRCSGTTIPVANAHYFFDGFGITDGDDIVIGKSASLNVIAVGYKANTLTVDRSVSWTVNQPVNFVYAGSAPDVGAVESGCVAPPTPSAGAIIPVAVTASWAAAAHPAAATIDGSLSTYWTAEGSGHFLIFDLGAAKTVNALRVAWQNGDVHQAIFQIMGSMDGTSFTGPQGGTWYSSGKSSAFETYALPAPLAARYLKIKLLGNTVDDWNGVYEVDMQ